MTLTLPAMRGAIKCIQVAVLFLSVFKNFNCLFSKVSIIPRGKGLGYAQYLPREQYLYSKEQVSL